MKSHELWEGKNREIIMKDISLGPRTEDRGRKTEDGKSGNQDSRV